MVILYTPLIVISMNMNFYLDIHICMSYVKIKKFNNYHRYEEIRNNWLNFIVDYINAQNLATSKFVYIYIFQKLEFSIIFECLSKHHIDADYKILDVDNVFITSLDV